MKQTQAFFRELVLPFILTWFFASAFVDIVAVPSVFKFTSNLQEAGKIGMTVFGRFNKIEIFFALMILAGILSQEKKSKLFMTLSMFLLGLAIFYNVVMTPAIANAGVKMHSVNVLDPLYQVYRNEHAKYHNLYRYFDSTKLIVLLVFAGLNLRLNMKQKRTA
jgi:hypothetical protein